MATSAATKVTPQPVGAISKTGKAIAQQINRSLAQGKTPADLLQKLHTLSPKDQKAALAAMQTSYPAAWKAYQQAKAAPGKTAGKTTTLPATTPYGKLDYAKDFTKAFVQGLINDTPTNLKKFGEGLRQSGLDTLKGMSLMVQNPKAVLDTLGQQIRNQNAKMGVNVYLAGVASGLFPGDQQAAIATLKKLPGAARDVAGKILEDTLSDPKKIGELTGGAMLGVVTDGALSAAGKGAGVLGRAAMATPAGQRVVTGIANATTKGNQVLDGMAQMMFPKGPGPGMTPALALPAGGMTNAGAGFNAGLKAGQFPKGLGLAGVGTADYMAKSGQKASPTSTSTKGSPSRKAPIKAADLPTDGKIRYIPPKDWDAANPLPTVKSGGRTGYVDRFGNVWVKGPSRTEGEAFEWDVQLSRQGQSQLGWATRDSSHLNVSLRGRITHK